MYINKQTYQYPLSELDIRRLHPNISFGIPFVPPSIYAAVESVPRPVVNPLTHVVFESAPEHVDGIYRQNWTINQASPESIEANLSAAKADKKKQIESVRSEKETAGFPFVFSDGLGMVQSRERDIRNINGIVTTALILKSNNVTSASLPFRDLDNNMHMMTPTEALQLGLAATSFVSNIYNISWAKKAEVDGLTTENIATYDVSTGW